MENKKYYEFWCGNKVSEYGLQYGYVDYATLAKAFDAVLNNDIMEKTSDIGYWEQENGIIDNSEEIEEAEEAIEAAEEEKANIQEAIEAAEEEYAETETDSVEEVEAIAKKEALEKQLEKAKEEIEKLESKKEELEEEAENSYYQDIYQYYIISDNGADLLKRYTDEIVFYNSELDMYIWGITHYGTSWSYVLTNIKLEEKEN